MLTFRLSISRVYIENSPNKHLVEINRHLRSLRWQLVPLEGRFFFIVLSTLRVCEPWNYPTPILWAINWESASKCLSNCLFNVRSRAGFSYIAFSGCGFSKCIWFFFRIGSTNPMGIESKRERESARVKMRHNKLIYWRIINRCSSIRELFCDLTPFLILFTSVCAFLRNFATGLLILWMSNNSACCICCFVT